MTNSTESTVQSCDVKLNRSQFLSKLIEKAVVAGSLAAVPAIADAFLAPSPVAAASGGAGTGVGDGGTFTYDGTGKSDRSGTGVVDGGTGTGASDGTGAVDSGAPDTTL